MQTEIEIPVREKKQAARLAILERSIDEDREAILDRWAQTFIHVGEKTGPEYAAHSIATNIMMVAMAAVAKGHFEVSASGENNEFEAPSHALCIADYLSHASRVMIDLSELSPENQTKFLKAFPKDRLNGRTSTHYAQRLDDILTEEKSKGFTEGFKNVVDAVGKTTGIARVAAAIGIEGPALTDYGVDIMMGGVGQLNLSGGYSELGKDGHILIHLCDQQGVMIGLEQTTPPITNQSLQDGWAKAGNAIVGLVKKVAGKTSPEPTVEPSSPLRKIPSPPLACDDDNSYGLSDKHSIFGLSDDYTASGSIYFSNLIYKIKLMEDKQVLTPAKYNGMRVHLNDGNFAEFLKYYKSLAKGRGSKEHSAIKDLLRQLPQTASHDLSQDNARKNHLSLIKSIKQDDLDAFFKQLSRVYIDDNLEVEKRLLEQKLIDIQAWLAEPRQLPSGSRVLKPFGEDDFTCFNSHVHRLVKILNQAVLILEQNAIQELKEKLEHPSEVIQQMQLLSRAYQFITPNEDARVYKQFNTQREEYYSLCQRIRITFGTGELSFGYLMDLQAIESKIAVTLSTDESRVLIALMNQNNASQRSIDELRAQLEAAREQNERLETRVDTTVVDATPNLEIEALRRVHAEQSTMMTAENETLRAEFASYREEIAALRAALHTQVSTEAPPEVIIQMGDVGAQIITDTPSEALDWDWSFVCQCLCSPTALNCYGALLMIAGALIVAATVVGAIPLVLGVTVAAAGVAMSSACFFSARQNHSTTELVTPELPRQEV